LASRRTTVATAVEIEGLRKQLENNKCDLNERLEIMKERLELANEGSNAGEDIVTQQERLSDEIESIKSCLAVCARASERLKQAENHEYEDVSVDETGRQFIFSTTGGKLTARRVKCSVNASQLLGAMSSSDLALALGKIPDGLHQTTAVQNQSRLSTPFLDIRQPCDRQLDRRG
jgi:hypothetical protein